MLLDTFTCALEPHALGQGQINSKLLNEGKRLNCHACTQEGPRSLVEGWQDSLFHRDVTYDMLDHLPMHSSTPPSLAQITARLPPVIVMGGVVLLQALRR